MAEPKWKQALRELIDLLERITEDGRIDGMEIGLMHAWKARWKASLRANALREFMEWFDQALADGQVDQREVAQAIRWCATLRELDEPEEESWQPPPFTGGRRGSWRDDPMSDRQADFLRDLGATPGQMAGLSKGEASALIDTLLNASHTSRSEQILEQEARVQAMLDRVAAAHAAPAAPRSTPQTSPGLGIQFWIGIAVVIIIALCALFFSR